MKFVILSISVLMLSDMIVVVRMSCWVMSCRLMIGLVMWCFMNLKVSSVSMLILK